MSSKKQQVMIAPYEAVGVVCAQSIGEPGTQMSIDAEEKVLVRIAKDIRSLPIGAFTDAVMGELGAKKAGHSEVCDIPESMDVFVPSLRGDGRIKWKRLLQVSRHKNRRKLIRLTTRSGRSITATDNHSFVVRKDGIIMPVTGKVLKKGERIPVMRHMPVEGCPTLLDLSEFLPKDRYWFGSELKKAAALGEKYQEGYGVRYHVPVGLEQLANHLHGNHETAVESGFVYPYMNHSRARIPERLKLDGLLGWFVGAYLAEGTATRYYVSISNTDEGYLSSARRFARKLNLSFNEYDNHRGFSKGHDLRVNSAVVSDFLKKTCGSGCAHKKIPDFAFGADEQFVASLLRAYFDGDGNVAVDRNAIRASSLSEELIDGIAVLLARFGIFSTKRSGRREHSLSISYRYAPVFKEKIGLDTKNKALATLCRRCKGSKKSYDSNDMVSGFGSIFYEIAEKLCFPKRLVNNFTKRQRIGRTALQRYIRLFEKLSSTKKVDISNELAKLRLLVDEDVVWDEIAEIKYVEPSNENVYDFSVEGLETFTTSEGIVTHNTMRTFHYAGVAEHVPTGLPRLIEIVDAKKEPKKAIIDIYLKSPYGRSRAEAEKAAKGLSSVFVSDVARVEDNLEKLIIRVMFSEKDGKAQGITFGMLKKALEHFGDLKVSENIITLKPSKEKKSPKTGEKKEKKMTAKSVRKLTQKVKDAIVHGVRGIQRAVVLKGDNEYFIRAAGFNIIGACENPAVDQKRIYTNNIKEIERVYGIIAARNAIVKETKEVLDMQKLYVDIRHIMLIADAMTYSGSVKSIGRHGLSGEKVGVLGRAAFEETIKHLINASAFAEEEKLVGVTENIIVGQTVPVGTGKVRLVMRPPKKKR